MARLSWWMFSPYSDWNLARNGRRDGRQDPPLPPWNAEQLPPYLRGLRDLGDDSIGPISRSWSTHDEKLKPKVRNALREREDAAKRRLIRERRHEEARDWPGLRSDWPRHSRLVVRHGSGIDVWPTSPGL